MVTAYSILPYLLIMAGLLLVAGWVLRLSPFFRNLLAADAASARRHQTLDGLRGFLALGVVFSHATSYRQFFSTQKWDWPPSNFYTLAGEGSVLFFFMLTGYLFWSKAIAKRGMINPLALYRNRFWRIYPLYAAVVAAGLFMGLVALRFHFEQPLWTVFKGVARLAVPGWRVWCPLDSFSLMFFFMHTWTLWYECVFYLVFPILALFATPRRFIVLVMIAIAGYVFNPLHIEPIYRFFILAFVVGMAVAHLTPMIPQENPIIRKVVAVLPWLVMGIVVLNYSTVLAWVPFSLAAIAFQGFVLGCDGWGLLTHPTARLLGTISYSVYLVHMLVLYGMLRGFNRLIPINSISDTSYWLLTALTILAVVGISLVTYRLFEHPFLHVGSSRQNRTAAPQPAPNQIPPRSEPVSTAV